MLCYSGREEKMKKGLLSSALEAVLRTAYKCFNLYLGTQIYFSVDRGAAVQPHAWVAYFNVEGSTRAHKDKPETSALLCRVRRCRWD